MVDSSYGFNIAFYKCANKVFHVTGTLWCSMGKIISGRGCRAIDVSAYCAK